MIVNHMDTTPHFSAILAIGHNFWDTLFAFVGCEDPPKMGLLSKERICS